MESWNNPSNDGIDYDLEAPRDGETVYDCVLCISNKEREAIITALLDCAESIADRDKYGVGDLFRFIARKADCAGGGTLTETDVLGAYTLKVEKGE